MIEVNNLKKKYGDKYAVNDISFTVEKGKIYGLLGANGAGKSTTMNIITGYLAPTDGTVLIDGIDISKNPQKAKTHIGYLPEIPPLYFDMTVREYLNFCAELKRIPRANISDAVEDVINITSLSEVEPRLIKNLSKGYRQRVGLAQAVLGDPDIVILDEPTAGLDPLQIVEIRNLIESLKEKHTVILSSHILSEIESVCDQIIIISKGQLVAMDTPDNLKMRSQNQNVVELLIKGSIEAVKECLHEVEDIDKIEFLSDNKVLIYSTKDIREALFFACADRKMPILSMKSETASLEEIFIELTKDNENEIKGEEE